MAEADVGNLVCSHVASLIRSLTRFTKEQLMEIFKDHLSERDKREIDDQKSKRAVATKILSILFSEGMTYAQLSTLDILYLQQHSDSKLWHAFKLIKPTVRSPNYKEITDASTLESVLSTELTSYFRQHTAVHAHKDALWIRIGVLEGVTQYKAPTNANTIFLIYYPESQYILTSTMKAQYKEFILQSLISTFQLKEIHECDLSGKSIDSLYELLLYQKSQGQYRVYRENKVDENPLNTGRKKPKRAVQEPTIEEDRHVRQRIEEQTKETFGDHIQPAIERVNFTVTGKYKGNNDLQVPGDFVCKVTFEGSNILEGIKSMVTAGVARQPLPSYLADLHSQARNLIVLEDDTDDENDNNEK